MDAPMFTGPQAYERFMGRWSRMLAAQLVEFLGLHNNERVLDVGCGTGALSAAILARHPDAIVTGIDPSAAFVDHARATLPSATVSVGSATNIPFPANSFDTSVACLVLNFVDDPTLALAQMCAVTKPGGQVAAAVWDHVAGMMMLRLFWETADAVDPSDKMQEPQAVLDRDALIGLWTKAGLQNIEIGALKITMPFKSFDDYWQPFLMGQGPAGAYVRTLAPTVLKEIANQLRRKLLRGQREGAFILEARAWAVRGNVPKEDSVP
jgi:SAM-dependent methyltransferase